MMKSPVGRYPFSRFMGSPSRTLCNFVVQRKLHCRPLLRIIPQPRHGPQRPDCLAGVGGLELRNVDANYLFERSHRFAGIQPNSGFGDYSGLSAALGIRSSGVAEQTPALSATTPVSSRLQNGVDSVERLA